ncbi:Flp family type IVb pilin [Oricola sp.]|uniref:Flp family type IVb pilin n=1 Tax=Oricola sp. TaxID=1979950 RepID=UPI0025F9456A|nr:Flp family type IVb pilin [Oricola sp.]MCI5074561.1 Flp family type IVb pilin [Oricola sp.]
MVPESGEKRLYARFVNENTGAMVVEYGLIVALVTVSIVGGSLMIGSSVNDNLESAAAPLTLSAR